jgi:hypothetical protein
MDKMRKSISKEHRQKISEGLKRFNKIFNEPHTKMSKLEAEKWIIKK